MIINNNFSMRAICIGGVVGLLVAVGANYLLPKSNTQSQPAYTNSKIEKTTPAFVTSNGNPLLHLKTTILKVASDAQEFTRMIGRKEHVDQMISMDVLAKSIKKESNHSEPHSGLANEPPLALKGTLRAATTAEVLDIEAQKLIEKLEQIARDINEAAYRE
jgi:hypothetical protein